jgi:hypothetical protein
MFEKIIIVIAERFLSKGRIKSLIDGLSAALTKHVEFFEIPIEGSMRKCVRVADHLLLAWHPRPPKV